MGKYLTYDEYLDLGGTIPEMPFDILELKAEKQIDKYTYGRLKKISKQIEEVKMCMYSLIAILQDYEAKEQTSKNIASENTDGYSVSYISPSSNIDVIKAKNFDIRDCIDYYLNDCILDDGTPYLYI